MSLIRCFSLLLLLFFALTSLSCGGEDHLQESSEERLQDLKVETARGVETIYSDKGEVKVKVNAPLLLRYKNKLEPYMEFPEGLEVQFFNDKLMPTSHLVADYAIKYDDKQHVIIRDNIVVVTAKKERLETDELIWDEAKNLVTSDKKVKIITADHEIEGLGFTANQEFTEYEITEVTGTYRLAQKGLE